MKEEKRIVSEKATNKAELKTDKVEEEKAVIQPVEEKALKPDNNGRNLARPTAKTTVRRRHARWPWLVVLVVLVGAGVGGYFWLNSGKTTTTFQGQTTTVSKNNTVGLTVSATGQVQAKSDLALTFSSSGTLTEMLVKQGDKVTKGQVIAKIDDRDLQTNVKTNKASLDSATANLAKTKAGSTEEDIKKADEQLKQAKIKAVSTRNGNSLPAEIQSARSQLDSARTKLEETKKGGSDADKLSAQASVTSAEASLSSAQAKLDSLLSGPTAADVSNAQATVDQAKANLEKNKSSLYAQIVNAQVARDQALTNLNRKQDNYTDAYNDVYDSKGKLKSGVKDEDITKLTSAKRDLDDAQGNYNKADVALNDSKVAYDTGVRNAQSTLDNAQVQLEKTKAGATTSEISSAKASVESAKASLDNAKANVAKLAPTAADIASAQASVDSAYSNLAKLTSGGTQSDIDTADSNVRIQELTLQNLQNGPTTNDIAIQQATVDQAKANYERALTQLDNAVLTAPFDGIISNMSVIIGQSVTAATTIAQLIDTSEFHVDVSVGESDISKIKLNLAVTLTFDAIANQSFTGKITYIAPKSQVTSNVVSYVVTVTLDQGSKNSLQEAFPEQYKKYQQSLQQSFQSNAPGGQAAPGGAGGFPGGAGGLPSGGQIPAEIQAQINSLRSSLGFCGYSPNLGTSTSSQPKVGMTASITVCLDVKAGVLAVPTRAIKTKTDGGQLTRYVEVLDAADNKVQKTVVGGLAGDSSTEVTGGDLKEGDKVITSSSPTNTSSNNGFPFPSGGTGSSGGISLNR